MTRTLGLVVTLLVVPAAALRAARKVLQPVGGSVLDKDAFAQWAADHVEAASLRRDLCRVQKFVQRIDCDRDEAALLHSGPGTDQLGIDDAVDASHPNDLDFARQADALAKCWAR